MATENLDPKEALTHIRTLARVASESDDSDVMQEHLKMILAIVDKALPRKGGNRKPRRSGVKVVKGREFLRGRLAERRQVLRR